MRQVKLVEKKEFAAAVYSEYETFVVCVTYFASYNLSFYPSCSPQIVVLIAEEAFTAISTKYSNFTDMFSPKLTSQLSKYIRINDYTIEIIDS